MKLILKGNAGQGIQFMSFVLANILKDNSYNVSIISEYSPLMRSGDSTAKMVFSKEKIDNPIIEDADIEYDLRDEKFKGIKVLNMFLIGKILKEFKIKLNNVKEYLPERNKEENLEAIENGYGIS